MGFAPLAERPNRSPDKLQLFNMDQYIITHDQLKRIVEIQPSLIDIAKTIQKQSISDTEDCPLCGASMEKRWCNLSPLLVKILVKAYSIVVASNQNRFRLTHFYL